MGGENENKKEEEGREMKKVPQLLKDFMTDILTTFPEYGDRIERYALESISTTEIENGHMDQLFLIMS